MAAQTNFRPQLHGFDFRNEWDTDDNQRNFIRQKVSDAVPLVAKVIATNPGIGAALAGALGIAYGVGEILLPGIFDLVVIPLIVNQIKNTINDKINNGLPDTYGACGGMAFVPLDYYYNNWMIPKGVHAGTSSSGDNIDVPPVNIPNAKILRDYIYQRFEDTWDAGGVLNKMLEWYIILKTVPAAIGGGGPEIQNRCKAEWVTLAGLLDQGKPQPIALLFDSWDIFDNHQVVAYGYGGDPSTGSAFINIYDNNHPDQELRIVFDFTGSEMQGTILQLDDTEVQGNNGPEYQALKGFFCTTYSVQTPPNSWALTQGLTASPSACQSVHENFNIFGTASNSFTFFQSPSQITRLTPLIGDIFNNLVPAGYPGLSGHDVWSPAAFGFNGIETYDYAGNIMVFSKAYVFVLDNMAEVALDQFGNPLACIVTLPALDTNARSQLLLHVLPELLIVVATPGGDSCSYPLVEGASVYVTIRTKPFQTQNVRYDWSCSGVATGNTHLEKLELENLPGAGTSFTINVKVTNLDTGCIATGHVTMSTYSARQAALMAQLCRLRHLVFGLIPIKLINPLGPDDPEFGKYINENVARLGNVAKQIAKVASEIKEIG